MKLKIITTLLFIIITLSINAQRSNPFHTLSLPSSSPQVVEMQKLGITEIEINYHSPELRNRDVWNTPSIIPQKGEPIPWRAGANMNTTISFSTDVLIEGNQLVAGKYGLHIIPDGNSFEILFAHNNNQWGSYYLDQEKDVTLKVKVEGTICEKSEQLDFEFLNRSKDSLVIGLEWGTKRIPFTVSVDLNKTVLKSLKSELRGLNTYHWQAWNDAANWCLANDTNLEEALLWAIRSIDGGYNGFGANKNLVNLSTKAKLEQKLNRSDAMDKTISQALATLGSSSDINTFTMFLVYNNRFEEALKLSKRGLKEYPDTWYLLLNQGVSNYFLGNKKSAIKTIEIANEKTPIPYKKYVANVLEQMKNGTYKL